MLPLNKLWESTGATSANFAGDSGVFPATVTGFSMAHHLWVMKGLAHHEARVCVLEAHVQQGNKAGHMRN